MGRALALATLLGVGACSVPVVPLRVLPMDVDGPPRVEEWMHEGAGILGLNVAGTRRRYGSVTVFVFRVDARPGEVAGRVADRRGCRRSIIVPHEDAQIFAHELGHAFGLGHVDDPDNVMHPVASGGTELEQWQIDVMYDNAARFGLCR